MALLLSIETSTHHFSCALHQDEKLIGYEESSVQQSTASQLAVIIDRLFTISQTDKKNLSAVAVAAGPGSYTGLRIGTATAKGICYALNIPLISVNTLYLLAYQYTKQFPNLENNSLLCPMLDARRMEVYCMLLDKQLQIVQPTEAKVIDGESFSDLLEEGRVVYFFGDGADKCRAVITRPSARFVADIHPRASDLGELALRKLVAGETENLQTFEPFYLKDFLVKKPKLVS
ncbi:MAG: tRNA (adenosine(37)-N6)-threonylcarbamoyltransferase complex dimerization subunit type 1 TsaB [Bacteroidetes bacterium]|nr:tRNA (adenosine(37)-N6)-threonylcarbamoyltransferase complex dimerization subunit type 1 TsaB [Bacteroidota bacterium]